MSSNDKVVSIGTEKGTIFQYYYQEEKLTTLLGKHQGHVKTILW